MTKPFARKFNLKQLPAEKPQWWADLLQQLKPAGEELDSDGLRLAVRENYLNFYHRGQAIAKVGFNQKKELYSELHIKYVFPDAKSQKYVRLTGNESNIINPENEKKYVTYQESSTLVEWIKHVTVTKIKEDDEKSFVENVVAANGNVIDMEMGLPGSGYRIDLVSLERQGDVAHVVFWEAKLTTDSRCRTNSKSPEVIEQLGRYRKFLKDKHHQQQLKEAYLNACKTLVKITELEKQSVAKIIKDVAEGKLTLAIDIEPRLLMYYNKDLDKRNSWLSHEGKLRENKVTMQVMTEGGCYKLQSKEQF
ncbi:hypothetical protein L2737_17010 [Shewanella electrodiphila]|uniref:Uncharacterized protein n=1 Tax=Shewanella electrodiphila TaxID=934143 RepID=A0ABT0KT32_9GAMM|nr:hypothetical protein [Shewanella electrodiphila]MCL1047001.1 hypothetical protein [Shewanella electrodiphila]